MAVYEEGHGPTAEAPRLSNLMNYAGAALSLALIIGVGAWGYKLVVRDVSGIPVVRAMEGDMRVLPDNPGGAVALHKGLAVNEVAASGEAAGPEDYLVLAPRTAGLAQEDLEAQLAPEVANILAATAPLQGIDGEAAATDEAESEELVAAAAEMDEIALLTQILAAGITPPPPVTTVATIDAAVPGVRVSLRPVARPATFVRATAATAAPAATLASSEVAVSTAALPAGTNLVHLGAFESPAEAARAWDALQRRLGQYLSGYERVIQVSNQSGGTWYRLRATGFADRTEARRLCAVLQAEFAECIPVVAG